MERECPFQSALGKSIGRVYTLDARKAKSNTNLVAGTCYVKNKPLFVLVDNGATHFFIYNQYVPRIGFEVVFLPKPMVISSTMNHVMEAQLVCRDCSLPFNDREFLIDLIFLPLKKIDVILGMDWLSTNSVFINSSKRIFSFLLRRLP